MKNAITIVREIQSANPTGLRSLFVRYGIGANPTPRNVILASMAFGDAFTEDLYALYPDKGNNFTGTNLLNTNYLESGLLNYDNSLIFDSGYSPQQFDLSGNVVSSGGSTKSGLDSFKEIFTSVADMIGTGVNTWNAVKTGKTVQTTEQQQADNQLLALQMQQEQESAAAKTRQIYTVGAILIVVVLAGIFIARRR